MPAYNHNFDIISATIDAIEEVALPQFGRCGAVKKNTHDWDDPVTFIDIALENAITQRLGFVVGPLGAISEEQGTCYGKIRTNKPFIETVQSRLYYFRKGIIIDPIDGTKRFRDGKPGWAVMMAMFESNQYVGAWIIRPEFNCGAVTYDVVSAGIQDERWSATASKWSAGRKFPVQSTSLDGTMPTSKIITIQESAFTTEFKARTTEFYNLLEEEGFTVQVAYNSLCGDNYGSAALDWSALAKGEIAGLVISSAPFYDEIPGALISMATGKKVSTIRGNPYFNPGLQLPDMMNGVMAGSPEVHAVLLRASKEIFGGLFENNIGCTLPRRLLPSIKAGNSVLTP